MELERQEQARANQAAMPRFAAWLVTWRARFGPGVRVLWARDGEVEVGVPHERRLVEGRVPKC